MEGLSALPLYLSPRDIATTMTCDKLSGRQAALTVLLRQAAETAQRQIILSP
jgi:hypothetical protein